MQEYFRLGEFHIFRAPVFVHWSALVSMGLILVVYWKDPIIAVIALLSFLSVILIHEIGHAAVANKMGYRVFKIKVSLFHGVCECQDPNYELDRVKIAWGGVIAQILVAMLVFSLSSLGAMYFAYFGPILVFLGYYSLLMVPYNLLPVRGLDGYTAWKIIPIVYQQMKAHSALKKKLDRDRRGR
jgi:stage IV sporulation protein FB